MTPFLSWFYAHPILVIGALWLCAGGLVAIVVGQIASRSNRDRRTIDDWQRYLDGLGGSGCGANGHGGTRGSG